MDRDTVIRLAREAGFEFPVEYDTTVPNERLERFAALVAAAEREECAKVFDDAPKLVPTAKGPDGGCIVCGFNSEKAAAAIRSRT